MDDETTDAERTGSIRTRTVPFTLVRSTDGPAGGSDGDGLTLEGYAAVFGTRTRIDSWEGYFDEEFLFGSFTKTLRERTPIVQFDHGHHPLLGSLPIGMPEEWREDRQGLYLRARLHDNWLVQPVRDAIASGALTGMSIRFRVIKETIDESGEIPLHSVTEAALFEGGPVVFPAYETTSVGVRSAEVARLLADPAARAELARALVLGTPTPEAGGDATSGGAATPDQEPLAHSGHTAEARARALALITTTGRNPR